MGAVLGPTSCIKSALDKLGNRQNTQNTQNATNLSSSGVLTFDGDQVLQLPLLSCATSVM